MTSNVMPLPTSLSKLPILPDTATQTELQIYKAYKDDLALAAWVKKQYEIMKNARSQAVLQWNVNLAFYMGRQYVELLAARSGMAAKLITPQVPKHRIRLTVNRIRPVIRTELAKLTSQKPNASVIPSSSDDEDTAAAYAAEQVWESISQTNRMQQEYNEAAFWTCITGVGFVKTWWDDSCVDSSGTRGDIQFGCVTPYHVFVPDLRTKDIQKQQYVMNVYTRTPSQMKRIYGDRIVGLNLRPDTVASNEIISDTTLGLSGGANSEPDSILVYELWAKPGAHDLLPNGGMVQVACDQVLYSTRNGLPYLHGDYPFTKFEHIPTGKFYSDSVIVDIIGLQKEYNRTRSQITESKNRMAKPQLLAAKGSVDVSKITTEPGQVIEYVPGFNPPQPLALQNLPPYVIEEQDRIIGDIEDLTGQHQVSRGEAPSGITAATAISFLQEKDDSLMSHTFQSVEKGWESIAKQSLGLVVQYWDTERTIKVAGTDEAFNVMQLKGADIKNNTDVRMEGGSSLPTSKAARQSFLMDLMKFGFITPEEGLSMLDMGGVQKVFNSIRVDKAQAQRENIKLKRLDPMMAAQQQQMQQQMLAMNPPVPTIDPVTGQPKPPIMDSAIPVNTWDNHQIHIEVHNNFRKSQAFEILDPAIQAEFEAHVNLHLQAINEAMAQVQAVTGGGGAPMPGMPPEPGMQGGPGAPPDAGLSPPEPGGPPNG